MTNTTLAEEQVSKTRRRRRAISTPVVRQELSKLAQEAYKAKIAHDNAKKAFDEAKAAMKDEMDAQSKTEYTLEASGQRPATVFTISAKTVVTIDTHKLYKALDFEEFIGAVSPLAGEVRKVMTENDLARISTTTKSTPSLNVRVSGKSTGR